MTSESVKLLSFWPSMFGLRVHYALNLKGVPYDYKEESLPAKSEELLDANPIYTKIPVLVHNGKPICESLTIVDYIDSMWPDKHKLLPEDPYLKYLARFWADFGDKKVYDAGSRIMNNSGEEQQKAVEDMKWCLRKIDQALATIAPAGKPFFGGDGMNFADVGLAPFTCWFKTYETFGEFKIPGPDECPHLHKWIQSVVQDESVKKSSPSPDKVLEAIKDYFKRIRGG